jgi:hypothetical protein
MAIRLSEARRKGQQRVPTNNQKSLTRPGWVVISVHSWGRIE